MAQDVLLHTPDAGPSRGPAGHYGSSRRTFLTVAYGITIAWRQFTSMH